MSEHPVVACVGRDTEGRGTRSLIPRAPCPVAVAPVSVPLPPPGPPRRIGVAYDASPTARMALALPGPRRATRRRRPRGDAPRHRLGRHRRSLRGATA